jgi:hypothetical protein
MFSFRIFTPAFRSAVFCVLVSSSSGVVNGVLEIGDLGGGGEEHAFVIKNKKSVHCTGVTFMRS